MGEKAAEKILAAATRFWDENENSSPKKIIDFAKNALKYSESVFIAVNKDNDRSSALLALSSLNNKRINAFAVSPWGFTAALNALTLKATGAKFKYLLCQSVEVAIIPSIIEKMVSHMDNRTVVIGAALPGHDFQPGKTAKGNGFTNPWNTCSIWNLRYLAPFGFLLAGEYPSNPAMAGEEEVVTISAIQKIHPESKAKLVKIDGIKWKTDFKDPKRLLYQKEKMLTKNIKIKTQLEYIGLEPPKIMHIDMTFNN